MAGLTDKLTALNNADLSKLAGRLDALLKKSAKGANRPPTDADLSAARQQTGLTSAELLAALEWARKLT